MDLAGLALFLLFGHHVYGGRILIISYVLHYIMDYLYFLFIYLLLLLLFFLGEMICVAMILLLLLFVYIMQDFFHRLKCMHFPISD